MDNAQKQLCNKYTFDAVNNNNKVATGKVNDYY